MHLRLEEKPTRETRDDDAAIRELDETMLLEALKETSIGTAGAVQVWAPHRSHLSR